MVARLLQVLTLTLVVAAAAWAGLYLQAGRPLAAVLGALGILFFYALVLALELALLRHAHGNDPTPRASLRQLAQAWWGETWSAGRVFAWQQPFRPARWPDLLPQRPPELHAHGAAAHPTPTPTPITAPTGPQRGVLLVHGFVCNRGFWNPWLARLHARGIPTIAVTLEPAFGSIDAYIAQIDAAVQRLRQATGLAPVVVAHSMGGLAVRRWLAEATRNHGTTPFPVHHVITLGSPHHGTWLAKLAMTRNSRQMQQLSGWLQTLAQREAPGTAARFTCFYSHCDNIVFPPATATLPGAQNVHLTAVAHVNMADRDEPWEALLSRLTDPAPAVDEAQAAAAAALSPPAVAALR
jgi:predicted alpha/beta hydrolase family esterase